MLPMTFTDEVLLKKALTLANGPHAAAYERLEFLGDRVLGLCVSDMLYRAYPQEKEGDLARRFTALVCEGTLAQVARSWGVSGLLKTHDKSLCDNDSVLSDVCESLLGAYYLQSGFDKVYQVVQKVWMPLMQAEKRPPQDHKTHLQELVQSHGCAVPVYQVIGHTGPPHHPQWTVTVETACFGTAQATAPSKRLAEQQAAGILIERAKHGN